jgi:dTMP kinase
VSEVALPRGSGSVLSIKPFRRLWIGLGLSSMGDWLGLLALTAMASDLAGPSYAYQNFAIAGVLFLRVLPAVVLGPIAGYIVDRLDRRNTLIVGDVLRGLVFVTIPIVGTLAWVLIATVVIEVISLVWLPAKDATVPNLVPPDKLETANQISIATTYGSALPGAAIFVVLSVFTRALESSFGASVNPVTISLWLNAASFILSAMVITTITAIPRGPALQADHAEGVWRVIVEGWAYVAHTPLIRGLVIGIVGAFASGGVVVGLGRVYVGDLGGGDPGYGLLFASVFAGLALGMWKGTRFLSAMSRRRLFGFALTCAGIVLAAIAVIANLVVVTFLTVVLGFLAGAAWITGYTLLGLEVEDSLRGRTFAFVQTLIRLTLALVLAVAPLVAGLIGTHRWQLNNDAVLNYNGAAITMFGSALAMIAVGIFSYHLMNDRPGISVRSDLRKSLMPDHAVFTDRGVFVAFEGGEGAGKSTQARLLETWLTDLGYDVVLTHEPGDSQVGAQLRRILLDPETGALDHRAEALLYAADKAEHVEKLVKPALRQGKVVVSDRYVDSTLAYQGAGRDLESEDVERIARWATDELRPHLTVLLDVDPELGLGRFDSVDRIEGESLAFHRRVRDSFLALAKGDPEHYLVVDARQPPQAIAEQVRQRLTGSLVLAHRNVRAER